MAEEEKKIDSGHVFYFEPNDLDFGMDQNGQSVPLMPHLEDMCLAMTLTADIFPRKKNCLYNLTDKNDPNKSGVVRRSISWISYVNAQSGESIGTSQYIVNGGTELGNEKYLTTYYTEISADKYIENELVEGLGVTSVNISFESWYTPTITINFVDVHGSALWGREEAIHDSGEITADNLLGVFFTQPYPLFRLQVKGFLGHDVTYQLSVSSFKGKYNAQTGNFEATVTFIGYSYSLLTDIPLKLLAIAPEMSYVGRSYWDSHVNSPQWQLINADGTKTPPVKLYQLMEDIRAAVTSLQSKPTKTCSGAPDGGEQVDGNDATESDRDVSVTDAANATSAANAYNEIGLIKKRLDDFIKECEKLTKMVGGKLIIGRQTIGNKDTEEQLLLLLAGDKNGEIRPNDSFRISYQSLCKSIDEYNSRHTNNKIINEIAKFDSFHKLVNNASSGQVKLQLTKIFKKFYQNYGASWEPNSSYKLRAAVEGNKKIGDIKINGNKLYKDTSTQLNQLYKMFNGENTVPFSESVKVDGFGEYAFLIPIGKLRSQIINLSAKLSQIGKNVEVRIENETASKSEASEKIKEGNGNKDDNNLIETDKKKIVDIIHFEPTIGNFTKLVMCHLETFIEVMMSCGDEILSMLHLRTPENFNLLLDDTDIPLNKNKGNGTDKKDEYSIFPWPALYNPKPDGDNSATPSNAKYEALGWTNDYPPKDSSVWWSEQKVVLSCLDALQKYEESINGGIKSVKNQYTALPLSGSDLGDESPFSAVGNLCRDIEQLTPYLGLRIANTIGVADNKCTADIAEAIGYMDALNLIGSCSDYKRLENAVTSKESNQDFATQVIDFLTCKNKIRQTSEAENGNKYNLFEFILPDEGNHYNSKRHPMFIEDGENYKYSYIYSDPLNNGKYYSIIPTELRNFTGKNSPYTDLFDKKNDGGKVRFVPTINTKYNTGSRTGISQYFVYCGKSSNIAVKEDGTKYDNFTNEQLFYVVENPSMVKSLLNKVKAFKNGEVKYKDYDVKGEKEDSNLKKFIDRRYKVSDKEYFSFFDSNKNYRILMPLIGKVDSDYSNKHLCKSYSEVNDVKFDNQWSFDTNSSLYKNTNLKVGTPGVSFKSIKENIHINDVFIGELPILTNSKVKVSLFGSQIYYLQNEISDEKTRDKAKAYLILSSMMGGIEDVEKDLFKSDTTSIIKLLPPFYVLFLGALLWRKKQDKEPLELGLYKNSSPDQNTSFISKNDKIFHIDTKTKKNWYTIEDYYMKFDNIDAAVKNKLIKMFEDFTRSREFRLILDNCELKKADGSTINGNTWVDLRAMWSSDSFDSKSPSQWTQVFATMFDKYTSITFPSSGKLALRLLFNHNNPAMEVLRSIYGLNGGYLVGRGTTKRVGQGENEVTVTKEQMKGYLRGFEKRIRDAKNTSTKVEHDETSIDVSEIDRDYAVSLYYSLKHLWDSWLITAARDQFTIENFFNKYFIFIDSFYMNTYNQIKLNCQTILDAYNTKDINLLTFIDKIASEERCMLFALPTFLDSNVLDNGMSTVGAYHKLNMEWKLDNLKKAFTPIPFNDIGVPQVSNVFVFVYTHPFSDNASEITDKKFDSYFMNDKGSWPDCLNQGVLKTLPKVTHADANRSFDMTNDNIEASPNNIIVTNGDEELVSGRQGYKMPCFGVTVNRGNNYIFKSINVNMDSPKITAISAQTYENILAKTGADGSKKVYFHGQDIYSIYSQYAYACEIEMIGCTQIQPLMYFQLLNIPMWRGTYMIYKVTHSMQPGNMVTRFTGIKMSRKQAPYSAGYFTIPKESSNKKNETNGKSQGYNTNENGMEASCMDGNGENYTYNGNSQVQNVVGGEKMLMAIFGDRYKNVRISSAFGAQRTNHVHKGLDLAVVTGTPLYAPWDGFIDRCVPQEDKDNGGIRIGLTDNNNNVRVFYMHCSKLLCSLGQKVKAGDAIALSGNTGKTTGSHLHLELFINGKLTAPNQVDPNIEYGYIS